MKHLLSIIVFASTLASLLSAGTLDATGYIQPQAKPKPAVTMLKSLPVPSTPQIATIQPIPVPQPVVTAPVAQTPVESAPVSSCGDNSYANDVYMKESGCSLTAVNPSSGDYGLGQSASGLASACPDWQTDYACQNAFFNNYAISRYGSWAAADAHEIDDGWW